MQIQTAQYANSENSIVSVNGAMSVPCVDDNRHWQMVQAWVNEGNIIEPYVAPPVVKSWSTLEFTKKFTRNERKAIKRGEKNDEDLADFMLFLTVSSTVYEDSEDLVQGMAYLVQVGIITQARHDEILENPDNI